MSLDPSDPSGGDNNLMDQHLTMWGGQCSAQIRVHDNLHPEALDPESPNYMRTKGKSVVLALYLPKDTPRSPEVGEPYLLDAGDMERLRDLLQLATDHGLLFPPLQVAE